MSPLRAFRPRRVRLAAIALLWLQAGLAPSALARQADPAGQASEAAGALPATVAMSAEQRRTVGLTVTEVAARPIVRANRVPGTIVFDPALVARLRPIAEARVVRLLVQPGETVASGAALAVLASPTVASAQETQIADRALLAEARVGVEVAQAALERGIVLARDGSLAWAEAQRRRLLLAQARANEASVQARMRAGSARLAELGAGEGVGTQRLTTPIGGVVALVGVSPGQVVGPAMAGDAFTVADLSRVDAMLQVPQDETAGLRVGEVAGVQLVSGGQRGWAGRIVSIGAAIEAASRTLPVRIALDNPDGALRSGMFVTAMLYDPLGKDGPVVPPDCVQLIGSRHVVFSPAGEGKFSVREVRLGVQRQDWVEISHGLSVGDRVVTTGAFALKSVLQQQMLGSG